MGRNEESASRRACEQRLNPAPGLGLPGTVPSSERQPWMSEEKRVVAVRWRKRFAALIARALAEWLQGFGATVPRAHGLRARAALLRRSRRRRQRRSGPGALCSQPPGSSSSPNAADKMAGSVLPRSGVRERLCARVALFGEEGRRNPAAEPPLMSLLFPSTKPHHTTSWVLYEKLALLSWLFV